MDGLELIEEETRGDKLLERVKDAIFTVNDVSLRSDDDSVVKISYDGKPSLVESEIESLEQSNLRISGVTSFYVSVRDARK